MNSIIARRSLLKFYSVILFSFLFFCAMGAFMIFMGVDPEQKKDLERGGEYAMILFGGVLDVLAFYTVYKYFKNTPVISVDDNKICFNSNTVYWSDIHEIELTGKKPFRYIFNFPMEGAKFTMNNGQVKYMFDDMYTNAWQVKLFIQEVVLNRSGVFEIPITDISRSEIDAETFETYT